MGGKIMRFRITRMLNPGERAGIVLRSAVIAVAVALLVPPAWAGSEFTYQGQLELDGKPVTDTCSFEFDLWDAATDGTQRSPTLNRSNVEVRNGLFTVQLDFGEEALAVTPEERRWLEIGVGCVGTPGLVTLPRQPLTSAPYAYMADKVAVSAVGTAQLQSNAVTSSKIADGSITASDVDTTSVQQRVTGACAAGTAMIYIDEDGGIGCESVGGLVLPYAQTVSGSATLLSLTNTGSGGGISATSAGSPAVRGESTGDAGTGVYGKASPASSGQNAVGVYGESAAGKGISGFSSNGYGVYGKSQDSSTYIDDPFDVPRAGVTGTSTASNGVGVRGFVAGDDAVGVMGTSTAFRGIGVKAVASGNNGIALGVMAKGSIGVRTDAAIDLDLGGGDGVIDATDDPNSDLLIRASDRVEINVNREGLNPGAGFAVVNGPPTGQTTIFAVSPASAVLSGDLHVGGNMIVSGNQEVVGIKGAVVATQDYGQRRLSAVESPENWFEDFGTHQLVDGEATVAIEAIFAQTVNTGVSYHVFLTPLGDCGLYVAQKSSASFTVRAQGGRSCSIPFDYRIVAKRLGYENARLDPIEP